MFALAEVISERGYRLTRPEDVATEAELPLETFEHWFRDIDECLLALCDQVIDRLVVAVEAAVEPCTQAGGPDAWRGQLDAGFGAVLRQLSAAPTVSAACLVESLKLGRPALQRRDAALERFIGYVDTLRRVEGEAIPRLAVEMLVRGTYELIYTRVLRGEAEQLPRLLSDLSALWGGAFGPRADPSKRFPDRPGPG
jgi:AcrR family transcriptional regulator